MMESDRITPNPDLSRTPARPAVSRLLLFLLSVTFLVVLLFVGFQTYRYSILAQEANRLAANLQKTFELNQKLRYGIQKQITMLHRQFEEPNPRFPYLFGQLNYEWDQGQSRYLTMDIGDKERLTVESIKALQSELAVQATQIFDHLRSDSRAEALVRIARVEELGEEMEEEFESLNRVQVAKLQMVLDNVHQSMSRAYWALGMLGGSLITVLVVFTLLLRRRVFGPLQSILQASDQIREGNLAARARVEREDEIGAIARGFNYMAESLTSGYAGLEKQIDVRSQKVKELEQQLAEAGRASAMARLIRGAAYELNNPLTAIIGFTELHKLRVTKTRRDEDEIRILEDILSQAKRCRRIVANLLEVAPPRSSETEEIPVSRLVEPVIQLREYDLKTHNVRVIRAYDPSEPVARVDPYMVRQAVLNLLNGIAEVIMKTGRAGQIRVSTARAQGQVTISFQQQVTTGERAGEHADARIADLGVSSALLEEQGGELSVEKREEGAVYHLRLPGTPVPEAPVPRAPERSYTALVIESESTALDTQLSYLSSLGIQASGVATADEAIQFLSSRKVDLVVVDQPNGAESPQNSQLSEWIARERPELVPRLCLMGTSGGGAGGAPGRHPAGSPGLSFEEFSKKILQVLQR